MSIRLLTLGVAIGACIYAYLNPDAARISLNTSEASLKLREFWHRTFFLSTSAPYIPREQSRVNEYPTYSVAKEALHPDQQRKMDEEANARAASLTTQRMPSYFLASEDPEDILNAESPLYKSLQAIGQEIKAAKPKAIIVVSPYWSSEERKIYVNSGESNSLIYEDTSELLKLETFESKSHPTFVQEVLDVLQEKKVRAETRQRGLDRGVWAPFRAMFGSSVSIPIIQVSQFDTGEPDRAMLLGEALAPLRDQGYMFIGTGMVVYNDKHHATLAKKSKTPGQPIEPESWTTSYEKQVRETMTDYSGDGRRIKSHQMCFAINFRNAHWSTERLFPLLFVVGASGDDEGEVLYKHLDGAKAWGNYRFGHASQVM